MTMRGWLVSATNRDPLASIERDLRILMWMIWTNIVLMLLVLAKVMSL